MKHQLKPNTQTLLHDVLKDFGLPDNDEHRQLLCGLAMNLGFVQLATFKGTFQALIEETKIDVLKDKQPEKVEVSIPAICDNCGMKPVELGNGNITCNCRVWEKKI